MRCGRSWFRASLLSLSLAALACGCASPLDDFGSDAALRVVSDAELRDVPSCQPGYVIDPADALVLPTEHDDLYVVTEGRQLVCADDGAGVTALGLKVMRRRDLDHPGSDEPPELRTNDHESADSNGVVVDGTPLPANR
jgi:hypothetical protein